MYNRISAAGVLRSMCPFSVNTNICVPHFHNFFWLFYNDRSQRESSTWTTLYLKMKAHRFSFVEENVWDNIAHSGHLSLSEEQETALRFKYLITHWLKWYLMPQASTTLRSNIKFTQKQETAQKSMEHSVSSKKSLLQPTPSPKFNDWVMETFLCGKTGDFVF